MGFDQLFHYLNLTLEVFFLDLLLSGDNAVVIALACRARSAELTRRAMWFGIGGAIVLRVLLTTVAGLLLHIRLLKLVGGIALTFIAIKLTIADPGDAESRQSPAANAPLLWSTISTIIVADVVMSVDNVVALAAVAQGNVFFLTLGLLMSVPLLIYGSLFVAALLRRYPLLVRAGGALLGWIAGDLAISDPLIADWVNQQSPALTIVVPILVVVFVLVESRIMEGAQATALALRPPRKPMTGVTDSAAAALDRAPAAPIIEVASRTVDAGVPPPKLERELVAAPRPPELERAAPVDESSTGDLQAPRRKRSKLSVWIIVVVAVAVLWLLFRLLSLDFAPQTPPIQFTRPANNGS
jgi:YjbE family integral membrane protein